MQAIDKFTVAILGDQSVGKTSLLNRFVIDLFQEKYEPTQGVNYISKTLTIANKPVRLQFFDICGNKQFISLISNYIKEIRAAIVCYDITRKDENSLKNLPLWIEAIKKANDDKTLIYILGNKSDLQKNRKVDLQQAQLTALSFNAQQFEVSAKSNHNIKDAFQVIANDLYHQNLKTIEQQDKEKLFNLQYGQNQTNNFVD